MPNKKVALVTGAGSGIGRASAIELARNGFAVGLLGRTPSELEEVAKLLRSSGAEAERLDADISIEEEMSAAVDQLIKRFGRLDVVVANASINGTWAPIEDIKAEEWDQTIAVNLRGTYLTLRFTVPHLKNGGGGSIVVVSSINGTRTFTSPGATAYSASKAAQLAMVQQLALELGRHRIRVNAVCPGAIETNIDDSTTKRAEEETAIPVVFPEGQVPLTGGRPGRAEDVAHLVTFLASDASSHITGTPIWIDGGQGLLR
ncbi:3-oxoacyl-[acyl-carrier-protein] reductase [Pleomorphomonas diazotrophica]|uniref:3-oxoacyl-[acyl-carrier-protein] reductase n=1 Tax=Pleomorphomonas diazotrophica TaxID=1166257 RepID=A0A1I4QTB5_9HYPH|nr:SDR family NAD(P)-dependent oxidoreductase [Pleomorphomonas diazotrophica]PKR90436.1 3-oxoacyl-[acyl-carrier-protein] reductase [Pleomorphomonas diazotrophica]SFM43281.1 NAD(P)-dependent dehydrogenase, short-chain alcohol dehydrogenase family [Pleomorphomonas diazotrophica]